MSTTDTSTTDTSTTDTSTTDTSTTDTSTTDDPHPVAGPPAASRTPLETVDALVDATAAQDLAATEDLIAPGAWLRALLPRRLVETTTRSEAVETLWEWFGRAPELRLEDRERHETEGRVFLRYRFLLRPDWEPRRWHRIEQSGFVKVVDGRITRLDLACSGYHPVEDVR